MSVEQNKQVVLAYLEQALNAKQPAEAVDAYVGPRYVQHNPQVADGPEAFIEFASGFTRQFPEMRVDVRRVVAEGDVVVTHSLLTVGPEDRGTAAVDIFRLEEGRIVEHWDVLQPVPESAANDNTMF
ncbi:MAG: ester cyclase [Actinomycetota bacterium]|nr:ester cyclase [Actinomycetota bacterium]